MGFVETFVLTPRGYATICGRDVEGRFPNAYKQLTGNESGETLVLGHSWSDQNDFNKLSVLGTELVVWRDGVLELGGRVVSVYELLTFLDQAPAKVQ